MPEKYSNIRIKPDALTEFTSVRLRVSAEIGWTIPAGEFVQVLARLGEKHPREILQIVRQMNNE